MEMGKWAAQSEYKCEMRYRRGRADSPVPTRGPSASDSCGSGHHVARRASQGCLPRHAAAARGAESPLADENSLRGTKHRLSLEYCCISRVVAESQPFALALTRA
eukprot:2684073-Pleurochrysis_carterae.AAC.2